jgi:hypothetical protein
MLHAGLDLSRRRLDVCLVDEHGELVAETAVPTEADGLRGLAARLAGRRVRAVPRPPRPRAHRCGRTCRAHTRRSASRPSTRSRPRPRARRRAPRTAPSRPRHGGSPPAPTPARRPASAPTPAPLPKPRSPTPTVLSPSSPPVPAPTAAIVCEPFCASAPSTIIAPSPSPRLKADARRTTLAWGATTLLWGHTATSPTGKRATQRKPVRPQGRQRQKRVTSPPVGACPPVPDVTGQSKQQAW